MPGEAIKLNQANLANLPDGVIKPEYDRDALSAGIIHIGLGNFHRAHQSWYLHRLFQQGLNHDWAIIGAGIRSYDAQMREKMKAQDYLTTLIELDPSGRSVEIVGSMIDYLPITEGNQALVQRMSQSEIRIVALTITEGGYYIDPATKGFDASHPDMVHDAQNPGQPRTAFGAMIAALKIRHDTGLKPFTAMSCDNIQGNGQILRQTLVSLARMQDNELADWIDQNCSFPNSMVDCIVPATGEHELEMVRALGIEDDVPVTHENFRQWVIEDNFCNGRPDWEKVGVTFSNEVHDFETMKIRILNGGHQIIADPAEIMGIETIVGAMENDLIRELFLKVENEEIVPHIKPVPGFAPLEYVKLIEKRFSNPKIKDTTRRVAFDGSSRHPGFLIPSIMDGLEKGTPVSGLALVSALWARYCLGEREDGTIVEPNDPFWDEVQQRAGIARSNPVHWLEMRQVYGDLADKPVFADAFSKWLTLLYAEGIEATLKTYLGR